MDSSGLRNPSNFSIISVGRVYFSSNNQEEENNTVRNVQAK